MVLILSIFSSCPTEKTTYHYYTKSFFMGETTFLIEGETFNNVLPPLTEPIPFDSLFARISFKPNNFDKYTEWEIPATKLSESRFQLLVDTTANGITIDKNIIPDSVFKPVWSFNNFSEFELRFFFNDNFQYSYNPEFKELVDDREVIFRYMYIYVAKPVDLSAIYTQEHGWPQNSIHISHCDLNFFKPGWYKIIDDFYREPNNDPRFLTGENTYFKLEK